MRKIDHTQTPKKDIENKRMTNRKRTGGSTVTPSFAALQKAVVATFVSPATWLPRTFSYWSGVDGDKRQVILPLWSLQASQLLKRIGGHIQHLW